MMSRVNALVSCNWLADKLTSKPENFRLLDGSWHMPNTKRDPKHEFLVKHIPGALFFAVDDCCDHATELDHMLPTPEQFEQYVGQLGICNDTHVVVYDNHPEFPLFSAQRIWWTFRVFGHDRVSLLEGGLTHWERDGHATTDVVDHVSPTTFRAKFRPELVKAIDDITCNLKSRDFTVIDARPQGRFLGQAPEPRDGIESGHMPGAVSLPFFSMFSQDKQRFKTADELQKTFEAAGIDLNKPLVASCGSGMTACMLVFAAHIAAQRDVPVYDGSWTEWYLKNKDCRENIVKEEKS